MNANDTMLLDATLRARHAVSLQHLSPRVQVQLAQRRNAALRGESTRRRSRHGYRYAAAGFAAVFALMIGLRFGPAPPNTATDAGTAMVVPAAAASTNVTMLDEDPEFYAWLGADDSQQVAME